MPDDPPRLFLSYGVRDASDVAERLHRDLTARGYKIWQDIDRIRTGWAWDNELQDGLLTSDVVLALLSPHSVRRVRDVGNVSQVDSVCLDEIAYARGARKIPIVPVQAVSFHNIFRPAGSLVRERSAEITCFKHAGTLAGAPTGLANP